MKVVSNILDKICFLAKAFGALLFAVMLITSLVEIVRRYMFGLSYPWADELIRYCIAGVAAIGGSSCYHEIGGLVSFDLLQTHLYGKVRLALELIINTIVLGFSGFMVKNSLETVLSPSIQHQTSIGLGISMMIPYMVLVIGMVLLFVLALEKYYKIVCSYKSGEYEKTVKTEAVVAEGGEA